MGQVDTAHKGRIAVIYIFLVTMGYDGICWNGCFGALTGSPEVLKSGFHGLIASGKSIVTTEMFSPAVLSFTFLDWPSGANL